MIRAANGDARETLLRVPCAERAPEVMGRYVGLLRTALRIGPSLRGYPDHGSRLDGRERGVDFFHERREVLTGVAPRPKQDDR